MDTEELFDLFDENNVEYIGQCPRSEVHRTGKFHRAVNVILCNEKGEILLQKRATTKTVAPGKWDLSVSTNDE